ncbi:MAG: ArsC family reductase [Verrucomicrobiaceae bacterium]|nr:ArsC family reductase [Verrucomicrobiaceae bacterium]
MSATLYGIKNCDTVKKARQWLDQHHIEYRFHDFRSDGLQLQQTQTWLDEIGIDTLLNKRGTTWKQLDENLRAQVTADNVAALMIEHPALIKRPVLDIGHQRFVGFSEKTYRDIFKTHTL